MGSASGTSRVRWLPLGFIFLTVALSACGSSNSSATATSTASGSQAPISAKSGDIVDTATYLTYRGSGFSIKYVEGWTIQQLANGVVIADKDSSESVATHPGEYLPLSRLASRDLAKLSRSLPHFHRVFVKANSLPAGKAVRAQYRTLSAQDPVTGKRVPVVVDRYYLSSGSRYATITLSTPVGVDNVDAFRLIARSYRWK